MRLIDRYKKALQAAPKDRYTRDGWVQLVGMSKRQWRHLKDGGHFVPTGHLQGGVVMYRFVATP